MRSIYRTGTPLPSKHPILCIFSTNIRTKFFKHAAHSTFFFSSKCRLFHNATFFDSCIIHILHTGCAKIWIPNSGAKRLILYPTVRATRSSHLIHIHFTTNHEATLYVILPRLLLPPPSYVQLFSQTSHNNKHWVWITEFETLCLDLNFRFVLPKNDLWSSEILKRLFV